MKRTLKIKPRLLFLLVLAIILIIIAQGAYRHFAAQHPASSQAQQIEKPEPKNRKNTYEWKKVEDGQRFINWVDGYQLTLPKDAKLHFDRYQIRPTFTFADGKKLDIYMSPRLPGWSNSAYYLELMGNRTKDGPICFKNKIDHPIEEQRLDFFLHKHRCNFIRWQRPTLKAIPNDQPHYMAIDMATDQYAAMTLQAQSAKPFKKADKERLKKIAASYTAIQERFAPVKADDTSKRRALSEMNTKTRKAYEHYFLNSKTLHWGIFEPSYAHFEFAELKAMEKNFDTKFQAIVHYMDFTRTNPEQDVAPVLNQAARENRMVELTMQTTKEKDGTCQVYRVLNGEYDKYLKNLSDLIRESDAVILLRVGNEMNGDWCDYSPVHLSRDPDLFVAFYRYIIDFFEKEGVAEQMIYVWNPNAENFPDYRFNDPRLTWPGDHYVDVVGMTAYNNGTYYPWEEWRDFDTLYKKVYENYIHEYEQPLMITEFASSSIGGDKPAWVKDMLSKIDKDYPRIRMAIWWNYADYDPKDLKTVSRPYYINDSEALNALWRDYFKEHNR